MAAPLIGIQQNFVGDHIQLLLYFTLHVIGAGSAHSITEVALANGYGNGLAGTGDDFDEQTQVRIQCFGFALLFDQEAGEWDAHGDNFAN